MVHVDRQDFDAALARIFANQELVIKELIFFFFEKGVPHTLIEGFSH
jgi:hypothetical protein